MKVAVVHNLRPGGAHRCLGELVQRLDAELVEVCLSSATPVTDRAIVIGHRPLAPGVPAAARPPLRYVDLARLRRAWRTAAAAVEGERPDVVFANPCRFLQAPGALLGVSAPSLYLCHEPREDVAALAGSRNPRTRAIYAGLHAAEQRCDRAATARATRLAANSRFSAVQIRRVYGRDAAVLPMGIPDRFRPTFEPAEALLSVGALIAAKGHELVIRAAALAGRRRPVVVVSPRSDAAEQARLERLAGELGVALTVRVAITDDELVAAYRRAFATLYMARAEPFGLAALEAQACGSPVIVSDEGGLPETLVDDFSGWSVPRAAGAVAARLDALEEVGRRTAMARAAAAHAGGATWAGAARALAGMLGGLAATPAGAGGPTPAGARRSTS